jgi:dihydroneopterin aldolase
VFKLANTRCDWKRMKKNNLNIVKIDKNKNLFNYEKKILIKELILDLKLGYYDFEKEKTQKVKFSLEIDYEDRKPTSDKDIKSIVNYGQVVKLITKLAKKKHYNFLETLAEDVFDVLFKDKRIGKIMLQIEKLEIIKECASVGIQITKKRSHEKL